MKKTISELVEWLYDEEAHKKESEDFIKQIRAAGITPEREAQIRNMARVSFKKSYKKTMRRISNNSDLKKN
jgi:hypothetical protein